MDRPHTECCGYSTLGLIVVKTISVTKHDY